MVVRGLQRESLVSVFTLVHSFPISDTPSIRTFLIFLALVILRQYIAEELERRESKCANSI